MARIADGTTVVARSDGDDHRFTAGDEDLGRVRGSQIEVGGLTATLVAPGERRTEQLLVGGRTPVLRLDHAGRKATWLTLSRTRGRLSRLRSLPFVERWVLNRDVEGPPVLSVMTTPLGTRLRVLDTGGLTDDEVDVLVAGALTVVLDVPVAETADV